MLCDYTHSWVSYRILSLEGGGLGGGGGGGGGGGDSDILVYIVLYKIYIVGKMFWGGGGARVCI